MCMGFDRFSVFFLQLLYHILPGLSRWEVNFSDCSGDIIYINDYTSPKELRSAIRDYVEEYNSIRPHQSLGYLTPDKVYGSSFGALA